MNGTVIFFPRTIFSFSLRYFLFSNVENGRSQKGPSFSQPPFSVSSLGYLLALRFFLSKRKTKTPLSIYRHGKTKYLGRVKLKTPSGFFILEQKVSPLHKLSRGTFDTLCPFPFFSSLSFSLFACLHARRDKEGSGPLKWLLSSRSRLPSSSPSVPLSFSSSALVSFVVVLQNGGGAIHVELFRDWRATTLWGKAINIKLIFTFYPFHLQLPFATRNSGTPRLCETNFNSSRPIKLLPYERKMKIIGWEENQTSMLREFWLYRGSNYASLRNKSVESSKRRFREFENLKNLQSCGSTSYNFISTREGYK